MSPSESGVSCLDLAEIELSKQNQTVFFPNGTYFPGEQNDPAPCSSILNPSRDVLRPNTDTEIRRQVAKLAFRNANSATLENVDSKSIKKHLKTYKKQLPARPPVRPPGPNAAWLFFMGFLYVFD